MEILTLRKCFCINTFFNFFPMLKNSFVLIRLLVGFKKNSFENPNGIKVSASGNLIYTDKICCLCGVGTVMKGAYSYVPLDSNESGDEYPLLHPKVRYVVHWTADTNGFQPVIEEHALSDYTYEDELVYG